MGKDKLLIDYEFKASSTFKLEMDAQTQIESAVGL